MPKPYILHSSEIGKEQFPIVGGKTGNLGLMRNEIGLPVPDFFATTTYLFDAHIESVYDQIQDIISKIDVKDQRQLEKGTAKIRKLIEESPLPEEASKLIRKAYDRLCEEAGEQIYIAIRSSATAEDLPGASFAGQQDTFLDVKGYKAIEEAIRECNASIFTPRATKYRVRQGIPHKDVKLSAVVQKIVHAKSAGVGFTIHPVTGEDTHYVESIWGYGEGVVQGLRRDKFWVKPDNHEPYRWEVAEKNKMFARRKIGMGTEIVDVPMNIRREQSLSDSNLRQLSDYLTQIVDYYKEIMDTEWAYGILEGRTEAELFMLQARHETVEAKKRREKKHEERVYKVLEAGEILVKGNIASPGVGIGTPKIIEKSEDLVNLKQGDILVTKMTDPTMTSQMEISGAVVTDEGGETSHAAIVSRELEVPCVVGTYNGTEVLKGKDTVSVDSTDPGLVGTIHSGKAKIKYDVITELNPTKTKIYVNLSQPKAAYRINRKIAGVDKIDGIGLLRKEIFIAKYPHILNFVNYDELYEEALRKRLQGKSDVELEGVLRIVEQMSEGFEHPSDAYVRIDAMELATAAKGVWPKPVVARLSDFKTNEYRELVGGKKWEVVEQNPMIGWRGNIRYVEEPYLPAFRLECRAMKMARDKMGFTNIIGEIPFITEIELLDRAIKIMEEEGLKRGVNGFQLWAMIETPQNVWEAPEILDRVDGASFGFNDYLQTHYCRGRDNRRVWDYSLINRAPGIKRSVRHFIKTAHEHDPYIPVSQCGQAASDFPEFAEFLVMEGIDSLSINVDALIKVRNLVADIEKDMGISPEDIQK